MIEIPGFCVSYIDSDITSVARCAYVTDGFVAAVAFVSNAYLHTYMIGRTLSCL